MGIPFPVNVQNTASSPVITQTHVQNQSGLVVPVSNNNPMPIQIITSGIQVPVDIQNSSLTTTKVTLIATTGIRDTNPIYAPNLNWQSYKRYCLRVENLLNQSVTITVQVQNIGDYYKVDGTPMAVTIPANTDNVLVTANDLPILGQPLGDTIAFKIKANTAPTSGTFTLYAYLSQQ